PQPDPGRRAARHDAPDPQVPHGQARHHRPRALDGRGPVPRAAHASFIPEQFRRLACQNAERVRPFPPPALACNVHKWPPNMNERPRLLIVDDERGVRESLRAILQSDCEVLTASSGDEALAIVGEGTIDVVTLDLKMPGLGGIGALERIKEIDPDIEVLIITGYGTIDTAIQGLRFRAFDYIAKPFDCDHVRRLVHAALARRAAARPSRAVPPGRRSRSASTCRPGSCSPPTATRSPACCARSSTTPSGTPGRAR